MIFLTMYPNLKIQFGRGWGIGGKARVSDFFYKESKSKKKEKNFFLGVGAVEGARLSDFFY